MTHVTLANRRHFLKELAGSQEVLAGSAEGRTILARLIADEREPEGPDRAFLDFSGIAVATASFLRDGPLAYRQLLRTRNTRLYAVIANANSTIVEEIRLLLESRNDAMFGCSLSSEGNVSDVQLLGRLDEKQRLTLEAVRSLGEADVALLMTGQFDPQVKATAWSNRLAALAGKGLLFEVTNGRSKVFRLTTGA